MKNLLILILFSSLILNAVCEDRKCGIKNLESERVGKIVGGHETDENEYPWQISLQYRSTGLLGFLPTWSNNRTVHYCGGSLINASWVVTAAHCVDGMTAKKIVVKSGKHRLNQIEPNEQLSEVEQIIRHENWGINSGENDIALLKLKSPFLINDFTNIICLPEQDKNTTGIVTITGWGALQMDGPVSKILMEVDIPTVSDESCRENYSVDEIKSSMICAGFKEGGSDSCQGDSGGPMIAKETVEGVSHYYLAGIVSWGEGCALPSKPGVYTEVSHYRNWIYQQMENNML